MKRSLVLLATAGVLLIASGTPAVAKYAGFGYNVDGGRHVGYLSWTGAVAVNPAQAGGSPHGGYTANTTKCAVCHSVHRAASDRTSAGVGEYWKLTPGSVSCIACHTASGSNPTNRLVEWPSVYLDGGPHRGFRCLGACHGSVHGANLSEYVAVSRWLLGNSNDEAIAAAFAAGNEYTAQDSIDNDAVNRGRGIITEETFRTYTLPGSAQGATTARAMRAMATGYTCGAPGCHSSSQFVVNRKGYAEERAGDPASPDVLDQVFTGHLTNITYGCPPCHMNDIAFYSWNFATLGRDSTCALCHDALGWATGSSAFPHANRNIVFLETEDGMAWSGKPVGPEGGNLWMYAGDATRRDAAGNPSPTGTSQGRRRTLVEGSTGFDLVNGRPGNINDGVCLKCHAYQYGGAHQPGGVGATMYFKADGEWTGNVLRFSEF